MRFGEFQSVFFYCGGVIKNFVIFDNIVYFVGQELIVPASLRFCCYTCSGRKSYLYEI